MTTSVSLHLLLIRTSSLSYPIEYYLMSNPPFLSPSVSLSLLFSLQAGNLPVHLAASSGWDDVVKFLAECDMYTLSGYNNVGIFQAVVLLCDKYWVVSLPSPLYLISLLSSVPLLVLSFSFSFLFLFSLPRFIHMLTPLFPLLFSEN